MQARRGVDIAQRDPETHERDPIILIQEAQVLCPRCGWNESRIYGTIPDAGRAKIRRYRRCTRCGARYATWREMNETERARY